MKLWIWIAVLAMVVGCSDPDDSGTNNDVNNGANNGANNGVNNGNNGEEPAVLLVGWTFHHEGWMWRDDEIYERYVGFHSDQQALFDEAGASMTSEVADLYSTEVERRGGAGFFTGLEDAGHSLGVHADLGGNPAREDFDQARFVRDLTRYRLALEETGVQVHHVSGICSHLDWVTAAREAGFKAVTGNVAYCLASLPRDLRPDPFKDCEGAGACHQVWPADVEDRIRPWRMKDGATWIEDDPTGEVLLIPTSGALPCFAEERADPGASHTQCEANQEDVDAFSEDLAAAIAAAQPGRTNTYYVVWSMGQRPEPELMRAFFAAVQLHVEAGTVRWATVPQMLSAFESE